MTGELGYFEIGFPDASRGRDFFGALLGWDFPETEPGQVSITTPTMIGGLHGDDSAPAVTVYFTVTDIDAGVRRVRELGGTAEDPGPDEPGFGRFSNCRDDQGVSFGLRQLPAEL